MEQKCEKRQRHFPRSGDIPPSAHLGISHTCQHQQLGGTLNPSSQLQLTREMHSQASGILPEQVLRQLVRCGAPKDHLSLVWMISLEKQRWWNPNSKHPAGWLLLHCNPTRLGRYGHTEKEELSVCQE